MDGEAPLSWPAIFAGAVAALAIALMLTGLAAGFGLTLSFGGLMSRASLAAFTPGVGALAIVIQVIAAGIGGYLAGRLRHHWPTAHIDEAHFRDTAHGLIAWALFAVAGAVMAFTVLMPLARQLAPSSDIAEMAVDVGQSARTAHIAAQAAFFAGIGALLSAFTAAVAARVGGLRSEDMRG